MKETNVQISNFTIAYPLENQMPLDKALFIDIETTGFTARSSYLYLIGCAYYQDGCWNVRQWFAENYNEETAILDAFFDFATQYALEHEAIPQPGEFSLSDQDYAKFVDFICASDFKYNRRSDNVLDLFRDVAKREGYLETIKNDLEALRSKLKTDLPADLVRFRDKIEPYICDELIRRYYYQKGSIRQMLVQDPCPERALELLSDPKTMWEKVKVKNTENHHK